MLVWKIAWRSFRRHRRRSIITSIAVALGLALLLVFIGLNEDGHRKMIDMGIEMGAGHVVVQGKGYQDSETLDHVVDDPDRVVDAAREIAGVREVAKRVRAGGLISTGEASSAVMIGGVDPAVEPTVSTIADPESRTSGEYLRTRDQIDFENAPGDIYVGSELASKLDLALGDRVTLTVSPRGSSKPAAAAFSVRGTFRTGLDELDGFYVEIELHEAQKLYQLGNAVTQVALLLDDIDDTDRVRHELAARLHGTDGVEVLPWQTVLRELYEALVLDEASGYLLMGIIFLIIAIGIFNTLLMSVVERTREHGVLLAIGTQPRLLFSLIVAESTVLALVSAIIGLAIGLTLHYLLVTRGLDVTSLYGEDVEFSGVVFTGRVYSQLSLAQVVGWTLAVMGLVIVSSLYPALRAARLAPLEAMRHA